MRFFKSKDFLEEEILYLCTSNTLMYLFSMAFASQMDIQRAIKSPPLKRSQSKRNLDRSMKRRDSIQERIMGGMKKGNWKKVFAFTKFISLAKTQSEQEPANLIIAKR